MIRERGYWKNFENVRKELEIIINKLDHFPTQAELVQLGRSSLNGAICTYHKGIISVRRNMGYNKVRNEKGYWIDWHNVKTEIDLVISSKGYFPDSDELREIGKSNLANAITKHHGGFFKVKKKMGYQSKKEYGYWKQWANVEKELTDLISKLGHFPSQNELIDMGNSSLAFSISKYHGGFEYVGKEFGYTKSTKPQKYWKQWINVEKELSEVISELGHFPVYDELEKLGYSGMTSAICEYHGGILRVRKKMGFKDGRKPNDYWKQWINVEKELTEIISELGHFPSHNELRSTRNLSLSNAISKYHGGFSEVKIKMGYKKQNSQLSKEKLENLLRDYIKGR